MPFVTTFLLVPTRRVGTAISPCSAEATQSDELPTVLSRFEMEKRVGYAACLSTLLFRPSLREGK